VNEIIEARLVEISTENHVTIEQIAETFVH